MEPCKLSLFEGAPFLRTDRGVEVPALRLLVWASKLPRSLEDGFAIDTGCDYDLILANDLRDRLRASDVPHRISSVEWGGSVTTEMYDLKVRLGGGWHVAQAHFPIPVQVEENLVGLPLLKSAGLCIRPPDRRTFLASAP